MRAPDAPPVGTGAAQAPRDGGLDGIRGVAVAGVLAFHAEAGWATGGFLGVSTFFTLSGFLITRLLVEGETSPRLGGFWARRGRRLAPALLVTIAGAILLGWVLSPSESEGLGADALAALGQVANWWFLADGQAYAALFSTPSLLLHTWSLSIEVQLYLVVPLLILGLRRLGWDRVAMGLVTLGLALASLGATLLHAGDTDRIYYGTDTRAAELLAGATLALLVGAAGRTRRATRVADAVGIVALVLTLAGFALVSTSTPAIGEGGLVAFSVVSAALVWGATAHGLLGRALGAWPLRRLGELSYAVYLFHWPLFLWLTPTRLGTSRAVATLLAVTVTLAAAVLSETLLEQPARRGTARWSRPGRPARIALGTSTAAVVLLALVAVPPGPGRADLPPDPAEALLDQEPRAPLPGAPTIGFFGDSSALALSLGVGRWAGRSGELVVTGGSVDLGCGLLDRGEVRLHQDAGPLPRACRARRPAYLAAARDLDLAVYMGGPWDVADIRLPDDDTWRAIGDPVLDRELDEAADELVETLTAGGATMVWVVVPHLEAGVEAELSPTDPLPASDPARIDRYNAIGARLAREQPGRVVLVDLASWMRAQPGGELSRDLRPDGVHLTEETAAQVAARFVGPELVRLAPAG